MQSDGISSITITDGNIYVRSEGDGIDSNGSFEMSGGSLTVMGPVRGGNGSLDVAGTSVITGGTVVMAGTSDMATNFTQASQGSILINTGSQAEGTEITVTDASGNVIVSAVADCSYQTVLISSPELAKGSEYTVSAGNFTETVALNDYIYGSGSGFGPGGMNPGGDSNRFPGGPQNDERGGFPGKDF